MAESSPFAMIIRDVPKCLSSRLISIALETPTDKKKLFFDFDGFRYALLGGLPNQIVVFLRNLVKLDDGQQLVLVILEDLGTELVAITIPHALPVDANFH